jgi:hypothetical protein
MDVACKDARAAGGRSSLLVADLDNEMAEQLRLGVGEDTITVILDQVEKIAGLAPVDHVFAFMLCACATDGPGCTVTDLYAACSQLTFHDEGIVDVVGAHGTLRAALRSVEIAGEEYSSRTVYNYVATALRALLQAPVSFNEQPGAVHPDGDLDALGLRSIRSGDSVGFLVFVHSFLAVDKKRNPELDVASGKLQALMDCIRRFRDEAVALAPDAELASVNALRATGGGAARGKSGACPTCKGDVPWHSGICVPCRATLPGAWLCPCSRIQGAAVDACNDCQGLRSSGTPPTAPCLLGNLTRIARASAMRRK